MTTKTITTPNGGPPSGNNRAADVPDPSSARQQRHDASRASSRNDATAVPGDAMNRRRLSDVRLTPSDGDDERRGSRRLQCLMLGKDNDGGDVDDGGGVTPEVGDQITYTTRYGIDHVGQSRGLCTEVVVDECAPCCRRCCRHGEKHDGGERGDASTTKLVGGILVSAIRSEIFLYTLHVTAIALGAVKEGLGLRYTDTTLNLIQSCVETGATLLLIVIRMFNAYAGYRQVSRTLTHVVHSDDQQPTDVDDHPSNENTAAGCCTSRPRDEDVHIRLIRKWMIVQLFAGFGLVVICVGCFFVFFYYVHLGWTVLSNNFCLITITVLSALYAARVTTAVIRIREDLHKVVIYDAQLVIRESWTDGGHTQAIKVVGVGDGGRHLSAADGLRFAGAVDRTRLFAKPPYIAVSEPRRHESSTHSLKSQTDLSRTTLI